MNRSQTSRQVTVAELALQVHGFGSDVGLRAKFVDQTASLEVIANLVDLTEAPEDAVCSLVADLMKYCEQKEIDWVQDVVLPAAERHHVERDNQIEEQ